MASIRSYNTANPGNGSSITVTKPTGLTVGDLMIIHYGFTDATDTASTISGWTHEVNNATVGSNRTGLQWKIADSADVAASDFSIGFTGAVASPVAGLVAIQDYVNASLLNDAGNLQANTSGPTYSNAVTPNYANNFLLFFQANNESKAASDYAIATSNPTWTEVYDVQGSTSSAVSLASATRTQTTSTGDSSLSLAGGSGTVDSYGILVAIETPASVSTAVSALSLTASIPAPVVTGGATTAVSAASMTLSAPTPTVTTPAPTWVNADKTATPSWVNTDKS